ncbi:MAG: fumarylacetoacetate hydrolase family protein [Paludibacteraceae bacterium]|jgi:2-keto-4-pentenoate hydratase/2-oxohepta-3-ene-1,7-dioic acid hydratase in catechol pathway|nr:fumarylacetoacetate hydrolase family protein [Paludibacteraceae bacterium]
MKIIAVGMNYADHIVELGSERPKQPVLFMKPDSALLKNNKPFFLPDFSEEIHYETELIVKIDRLGKNISEKFASRYYSSVGLGVDFTARDIQRKAREEGMPWELCKAFDGSAVISEFVPLEQFAGKESLQFHLDINGETVQRGDTKDMIFNINQIIAYASQFFTLKIGDIIFTGTPVGVGSVSINDRLQGYLEGQKMFDFMVK